MKKQIEYPVIEVPADGRSRWFGGAYTLAFLYSKKGNFVIKGYVDEVQEYIKKNYTHYFVNYTFWHDGQSRGYWSFWKDSVHIFEPEPHSRIKSRNKYRWLISKLTDDDARLEMSLKRLPKRWIKDFEQF